MQDAHLAGCPERSSDFRQTCNMWVAKQHLLPALPPYDINTSFHLLTDYRYGWPNNTYCLLCRHTLEISFHLLTDYRCMRKIWDILANWIAYEQLRPIKMLCNNNSPWLVDEVSNYQRTTKKGVYALILLTAWEVGKERNQRFFQHKELSTTYQEAKIKISIVKSLILPNCDKILLY